MMLSYCLDKLNDLVILGVGGATHPLDAQLSEHLEEVENMISCQENGQDQTSTPMLTPKKQDLASRRLMSQMTSTPQANRSLLDVSGSCRSEARPSPERLDAQMRHLTGQ